MSNIPLNERAKWLGASESAALFGLTPFTTHFKLWHQKAGNIEPDDLDDNERVQAGYFMEPSIAAWAAHKWEWPIRNVQEYLVHPTVARMGASLDFEVIDTGEPVEIKAVDRSEFAKHWEAEGEVILNAPPYYQVQVQHQLACRPGVERGWLVACVGGNRLYRMEIPRHDKFIATLEKKVAQFWLSIDENRPPDPDFERDASAISKLYGGTGEDFLDMSQDARMRRLCEDYRAAHEQEVAAAKRKKAALAEMKFRMNDARGAIVGDGYIVKASFCHESTSTRRAHWRFNVSQSKQTEEFKL